MASLRRAFCFWVKTVKGLMLSSYMALYLAAFGRESMLASMSTCEGLSYQQHTFLLGHQSQEEIAEGRGSKDGKGAT